MKHLTLLTLLVFMLASCEYIVTVYTYYIVENETDYDMRIKAYYKSQLADDILIHPKDSFKKKEVWQGEGQGNTMSLFDGSVEQGKRDSIVIIFDDKRYIVQWCPNGKTLDLRCDSLSNYEIPKNLAKITNYQVRTDIYRKANLKRYTGPFVITFTNEDYEQAQEL